jgi:transposase
MGSASRASASTSSRVSSLAKPTERLLGPGIFPEHLNDDTLGRALDALYETGVTELFRDLAAHAAQVLGLTGRIAPLDATSFHVDGRYNSDESEPVEGVVHIRQGYSRDHRPELNQVVLDLMAQGTRRACQFSCSRSQAMPATRPAFRP